MAKFDLSCEFTGVHGKLNSTSEDYFTTNGQTGTVVRCHRSKREAPEPTEAQLAAKQKFGTRAKAVSKWMKDPQNADALAVYRKAYKAQHKIGSLFAYLIKYLELEGGTQGGGTETPGGQGGSPSFD